MSIGPTKTEDQSFKTSITKKTANAIKDATLDFFKMPAYYIFWSALTANMVLQFSGKEFNKSFYFILIFTGIYSIYEKNYQKN